MNTRTLISKIGKRFPKKTAEAYDFPGLQVGKFKDETKTVLLCLDFDKFVLKYMKDNNLLNTIDIIFTHHPFIFGKKRFVFEADPLKKELFEEIEKLNIPIFSLHTNFDLGKDGMNDALTELLGLTNVQPLIGDPVGRGGLLEKEMEINAFAKYAIEKLNVSYGQLTSAGTKNIRKVAIIGGGGWRSWKVAKEEGYDIFISGDIPHHGRRDIVNYEYNYLDVPHEVERIFMTQFKKILLSIDNSLEIICVNQEEEPTIMRK